MRVSALVCVHSTGKEYDGMVIRALQSLVEQTRLPNEVIVVLDECPIETKRIVNRFACLHGDHITWLVTSRKKKEGLASAKNYGLQFCTGDLIAYLDADDCWLPKKLEIQYEFLEQNPNIGLCFTQAWDNYGGELRANCFKLGQYETHDQIVSRLHLENVLCHGSAMIRKTVYEEVVARYGFFYCVASTFKGMEDWELWNRLKTKYKFYNIPERLYVYSMGTSVAR